MHPLSPPSLGDRIPVFLQGCDFTHTLHPYFSPHTLHLYFSPIHVTHTLHPCFSPIYLTHTLHPNCSPIYFIHTIHPYSLTLRKSGWQHIPLVASLPTKLDHPVVASPPTEAIPLWPHLLLRSCRCGLTSYWGNPVVASPPSLCTPVGHTLFNHIY